MRSFDHPWALWSLNKGVIRCSVGTLIYWGSAKRFCFSGLKSVSHSYLARSVSSAVNCSLLLHANPPLQYQSAKLEDHLALSVHNVSPSRLVVDSRDWWEPIRKQKRVTAASLPNVAAFVRPYDNAALFPNVPILGAQKLRSSAQLA